MNINRYLACYLMTGKDISYLKPCVTIDNQTVCSNVIRHLCDPLVSLRRKKEGIASGRASSERLLPNDR